MPSFVFAMHLLPKLPRLFGFAEGGEQGQPAANALSELAAAAPGPPPAHQGGTFLPAVSIFLAPVFFMASPLPLTWATLAAHYDTTSYPALAPLAQAYYVQQGQLLTGAGYLALRPAAAALPLLTSAGARALVVAALPAAGPVDETPSQYAARGNSRAQPLLTALMASLVTRGITPADFSRQLTAQGADAYLPGLLGADFWVAVVAAWQRQVQYQLDAEGRWEQFLDGQAGEARQAALRECYAQVLANQPEASLEVMAALPDNVLARDLWMPRPAADSPTLNALVAALQAAAAQVVADNYPNAELNERLLAQLPAELRNVAQPLLTPAAGQPAVTSVAELAGSEASEQVARLIALPANHPAVYALAAGFQDGIQGFLAANAPADQPAPAEALPVRGQLLGAGDVPLPTFTLRLTQVLASPAGGERELGSLVTDTDGRFVLRVPRDLYLDADDAVVEAPATLRAAVYQPGQDLATPPLLTLLLEPRPDNTNLTLATDLLPTASSPTASTAIANLRDGVPAVLAQLLSDNGISSLADLRIEGGLRQLAADALASDPNLTSAVSRLEGLAQFEVVSADSAFHELVVAAGFYSPAQLLDSTSQEEFVTQLTAGDPAREDLRTQATAFYQQTTAVQALSQTLGLLTASGFDASSAVGVGGPVAVARFARLDQVANRGTIEGDSTTAVFGPAAGDDTSAPTLPGFHAATPGPELNYQPAGQCDCPACRSAVSPTAYLASLLKYAQQNLRYEDDNGTTTAPSPQALQASFLQPYCDLAVNCQAADEPVCQYRLAIEVIQAAWRSDSANSDPLQLQRARPYVEGVLEALLQALGTSLTELRATTDATRADLASRLRLPTELVSQLQMRFSASKLADSSLLDETEADLDELFGLASTAVDPLRTGLLLTPPTPGDPISLIRWNLQGLDYGINTDADGQLSFTVTPAGAEPHVTVYAGQPTEDNVVARGTLLESDSPTHTFTGLLYPQHGSGLSGSLVATVTGSEAATFAVAVVPAVTAGRQQVLAAEWLSEDAGAIALLQAHSTPSWNGFTFLVDPDLLGPDDFRTPANNRAYQLWRRRYDFLQDELVTGLLALGNPYEGTTNSYYTYWVGLHGQISYSYVGINAGLLNPSALPDALVATAAVGGLGALLNALTSHSLTYSSDGLYYVRIPWNTTAVGDYAAYYQQPLTGTEVLAHLHADCAGNTAGAPLAAELLSSVGLSVEAMQRLYELWQLNRTQVLSAADLQEALDIVRQSVKQRFESAWTEEELSFNTVALSTSLFQRAIHEPQVGIWQQVRPVEFGFASAAQLPRLDPDEVTPLDLPDAGLGDAAGQLWSDRQAELLQKRQAILVSGTSAATAQLRADNMLTYAYRPNRFDVAPAAGLPGIPPSGLTTCEALVAAAQNTAAPQNILALAYLATTLRLRLEEATRLVELRAQVLAQPAATLWQEMAALLTLGWKRAVAYRVSYVSERTPAPAPGTPSTSPQLYTNSWLAQEQGAPDFQLTPLDYFIRTRKHRLVKWRADAAVRAQWVQALTLAGQRPLLDPDQLVPGDFRQAGERSQSDYTPAVAVKPYLNPAFELYQQRAQQVSEVYNSADNFWTAAQQQPVEADRLAESWLLISNYTLSTQAELVALYHQQEAGVDVSAVLHRLQLTPDGLSLLVTQANRLAPDRPGEIAHLLTQLYRQRRYADWAREEIALRIVPTPYYFRTPQAEGESLAALPWRSSAVARRQWQRGLTARFGQAASLTAAQQQAVKAAEDQYLPLLRDALLVAKLGATSGTLAARATELEAQYLLDFQAVCCQHTTRVAQASTVLQKLFTNVRGGVASNDFALSLDDDTSESDWQWLSSYERWRSLMFLYLYPQNVLLPALKPGQSTQFRQTVDAIRQAASTSADDARGYMDDYQTYLSEISSLQVSTSIQTYLEGASTDGFGAADNRQGISLQAGLSAAHAAYVNTCYLQSEDSSADAGAAYAWQKLPGTKPVDRLIGMAVYRTATGERYAYLFVLLRGELVPAQGYQAAHYLLTVAAQRLNLNTLNWDGDYTELALPGNDDVEPDNLRIAGADNELWAPVITGLRNRREPLITEAPLALSAVVGASSQTLTSLLYEQIYNVDLFFCKLHVDGTQLGQYESQTVFMANDMAMMACTRVDIDTMYYLLANSIGGGKNLKQLKTGFNYYAQQLYQGYTIFLTDLEIAGTSIVNSSGQLSAQVPTVGKNAPASTATLVRNRLAALLLRTPTYEQLQARPYYWFAPIGNPVFHSTTQGYFAGNNFGVTVGSGTSDYVHFRLDDPAYPYGQIVTPVGLRLATHRGPTDLADQSYTHSGDTYEFAFNTGLDLPGVGVVPNYFGEPTSVTKTVLITMDNSFAGILEATPNENISVNNGTDKIVLLDARYTHLGPQVHVPRRPTLDGVATCPVKVLSTVINGVAYRRTLVVDGPAIRTLHQPLPALPPLFDSLSAGDQATRRQQLADVHTTYVLGTPGFVSSLVSEAYYALPMLLAQEMVRGRNYELALHYFRLIYDYTRVASTGTPDDKRLIYPALASTGAATYDTALAWLTNPDNPYTLGALRPNAHLEYVVMSVVRCLLAYADTEFTTDTAESVDRARTLYELAARLLKQDIMQYAVPGTADLLDPLDALFPATWLAEWQSLKSMLARVNQRAVLEQLLNRATVDGNSYRGLTWLFGEAQAGRKTWVLAFEQAWQLVNGQLDALTGGYVSLCATTGSAAATTVALPFTLPAVSVRPYVPFLDANFCVPTNPVPFALALQAELNLFKIRSCRNIAGVQRELDPYSAATDNTTGLPTLSSTGQLVRSTRLVVPATPFRYAYIMERARNLVALAQQTESSLLSALEKRDAEAYNQLKARQDIAVSQATVQLQTLRVTEAEDGVDLSGLQLERSQIMETQYDQWLSDGLNSYEIAQLQAITIAAEAKVIAAIASGTNFFGEIASGGGDGVKAAANAVAAVADAVAQISGLQASYQRRAQEWSFQRNLAAQDIKINQQQIKISNDQLKVVGQEKRISQLQLDHATAVLTFLTTKFTNAELYDWMSGILQGAYGYFLQQATATARLAEQQLAFERQQVPGGIVQADYYSDPTDDVSYDSTGGGSTTDRRGLTGSVRLLQDLTRLDEYAFETTKRKLQLSKTISLAQSFPTEFVRFRDTGSLAFACQPEWFDQDFPGQYLRVLRRVRTSVIALVPPVDGIKARLSTAGTSHVTVDGAPFQTLALPRAQEVVALTSPSNATGLFELDQQSSELLLPFEGLGVDVPWTFSMQPASNPNLDYSAVADVLITLDYSALESADYARQVVQQLGTDRQQQVVLSLRDRFADQWYDLHHADEVAPAQQYVSTLTITADDLPRSLRGASVSQVSLFVNAPLDEDAGATGAFTDRSHLELRLTRGASLGGAAFTNQYGLISTRTGTGNGPLYTGNAGALVQLIGATPAGDWTLAIGPGRLRDRLAAGLVNDIYLILEVEGDVPAYVL